MYLNTTVKIPEEKGKIIYKTKGGSTYVLFQYGGYRRWQGRKRQHRLRQRPKNPD